MVGWWWWLGDDGLVVVVGWWWIGGDWLPLGGICAIGGGLVDDELHF